MDKISEQQQKLIDCLKEINYSIHHCGCGTYQVVNDLKKGTDFIFDSERIELRDNKVFGKDRRRARYSSPGCVVFMFKNSIIQYVENSVHISNLTHDIFISFRKILK